MWYRYKWVGSRTEIFCQERYGSQLFAYNAGGEWCSERKNLWRDEPVWILKKNCTKCKERSRNPAYRKGNAWYWHMERSAADDGEGEICCKPEERKEKIRARYKGVDRSELEFIPAKQKRSYLKIQEQREFVPIAVFLLMILTRLHPMSYRKIIMRTWLRNIRGGN